MNRNTDSRLLAFLVPPLDQIKKNKKHQQLKTEAVGGYRHKRACDCMIAVIAFVLMERLDQMNISFRERRLVPEGSVYWADVALFDFHYEGCRKAFHRMMGFSGVADERNKVTHLRYVSKFVILGRYGFFRTDLQDYNFISHVLQERCYTLSHCNRVYWRAS